MHHDCRRRWRLTVRQMEGRRCISAPT
jgi:hypothetical protein